MENDNGMSSDTLGADGSGNPTGAPGTNEAPNGSIAGQNGQPASGQPQGQPDLSEENRRLKGQISALQRQMIQSRRSQGTGSQQPMQPGSDDPASQAQQQIAIAYQLADGQLREQMESIYDLYPEITGKELGQIRRNPWAYTSRQTFMQGDVETAKLEIEQYLADLVESRGGGQPQPQIPSGQGVNPSPAPQQVPTEDETPSDWEMPMGDLEKKVQGLRNRAKK